MQTHPLQQHHHLLTAVLDCLLLHRLPSLPHLLVVLHLGSIMASGQVVAALLPDQTTSAREDLLFEEEQWVVGGRLLPTWPQVVQVVEQE